jgi:25S rRNA (adenine2142-N1)-methyltransferase
MSSNKRSSNNKKKRVALPLAPPPAMRSRKKARVITRKFHALTREQAQLEQQGGNNDNPQRVQEIQEELTKLGGRQEYQRASQLSTSHHSTSKWVIGKLAQTGWLYGIREKDSNTRKEKKKKIPRRKTRLLEVGAINTELLTAAQETVPLEDGQDVVSKYRLDVRAIDLHSMHEGIEEADFLTFPLLNYDVVVCSMVINCVPTPEQRGTMLARLFHQLRPGGLCFFTLPKLCLTQSPFTTPEHFQSMLSDGVGFEVVETKESPKVSFFVLRRPLLNNTSSEAAAVGETKNRLDAQWTTTRRINKGKKYRNPFAVVLNEEEVNGTSLV